MAVTKIWPVRGKTDSPLRYIANEMKTVNPKWDKSSLGSLTDVMHYAADEDKTEKQFFVTGVNCSAEIARDQFVTVKKQFAKEDGIVAYHGYQSFEENEVTPELAHAIGLEFAKRVWGEDYQVVVATHLNTNHIHNHFVVNSISFKHGRRLRAKQWYELNKISDEICRNHGLSVVERPEGKGLPKNLYDFEKTGGSTRLNVARKAVDEAIAISTNLKEFELAMKSMGYSCSFGPNRKYWTIKMSSWKKPMRLYRMGEEYSNERIMERLAVSPEEKSFAVFQKAIYVRKQYRLPTRQNKIRKVGGLKGLYLHYCYLLGYLPKYTRKPTRISSAIRDDIKKMDMISQEARLIEKAGLTDFASLMDYKENKLHEIEMKVSQRSEIMKVLRRKVSNEEKEQARDQAYILKDEIQELRKEVRLAEHIEERSKVIEEKIKIIEKDEVKKDERRR